MLTSLINNAIFKRNYQAFIYIFAYYSTIIKVIQPKAVQILTIVRSKDIYT